MKFLKTPLHLTQVEKLVGFSFLIVIVILNVVIVSAVNSTHGTQTLQSEAAGNEINSTFGDAGAFATTTDPCGFANLDFQNNENNNATTPTVAAGGTGAGGNGTGGNGAGGNGTGGNGAGGNGTGGNGTGGNGTGGNGTGGNGTGGNGTGGNGTGGNGTGGNGTGGNGTGGNGTGGNGTGGNGTGGNGTGGNGTGGNGTGGNGTGGNGTGGNGTGGNGTGGNGTGGNGTGGNGTGGNGTGGNGTGGNGAGGNGTGGNGAGGNGAGGNGAGGNGAGGNGAGGNGTGGNGTGTIENANVVTCTDAIGPMNSNDILNYVLGDSDAGKKDRSANVNSDTMETGARFATTTEPLFLGALTAIYNDEFDAYADGLNYAQNPQTESVEQVTNNLSYGTTTVSDPESFVFGEVASCYKVGCYAGKTGHNGNYNDANMAKLLKSFGFTAIADASGVGQEDVNTYGAVVTALNEATPTVQLEMLNDIYTANAGNGTTTDGIVENLHEYKEALAFVLSDALATEEQDYATGKEITAAPTFNIQVAQQGYNFNCVGSAACPTVAPSAAAAANTVSIGANNGAGGNGAGGNGTGGNGTGGNGTGGNGAGGNGTGGNGTGGNGTGGNGTGGNGTGGNGTGTGDSGSSLSDLISQLMALITKLFGNL
jgi:hypothetical protein